MLTMLLRCNYGTPRYYYDVVIVLENRSDNEERPRVFEHSKTFVTLHDLPQTWGSSRCSAVNCGSVTTRHGCLHDDLGCSRV